jgi:hypothetical protein
MAVRTVDQLLLGTLGLLCLTQDMVYKDRPIHLVLVEVLLTEH